MINRTLSETTVELVQDLAAVGMELLDEVDCAPPDTLPGLANRILEFAEQLRPVMRSEAAGLRVAVKDWSNITLIGCGMCMSLTMQRVALDLNVIGHRLSTWPEHMPLPGAQEVHSA